MSEIAQASPDVQTTAAPAEPLNIAAAMARDGRKISGEDFYEQKEVPPQTPAKQVETTATPVSKETELTNVQATTIPETVKPADTPAKQPETAAPQDWKEVLKQQPVTEILKALGLKDNVIGLVNTLQNGGNGNEYLQNSSVDYTKMSAEDVMRRHLRKEYPEATDEEFEDLYRTEVIDAFKLDPDMYQESDVKKGKNLLNLKAGKYRKDLIEDQKNYILSPIEAKADPEVAEYKTRQEQIKKNVETLKNTWDQSPVVKSMTETKQLTIGEGAEAFNLAVNPQGVTKAMFDGDTIAAKLKNPDGSPNFVKQALLGALIDDDVTLLSSIATHYKALGRKEVATQLENPSGKDAIPSKAETPFASPAEAMAKSGRIVEFS